MLRLSPKPPAEPFAVSSVSARHEWALRPSRRQRWLNALLLFLLMLFVTLVWPPLVALVLGLTVLPASLYGLFFRPQRVTRIGTDHRGWWIEQNGQRRYVGFSSGSLRRRDLLVLNFSWRPWDSLLLRADSMTTDDDFRRLKAALYGQW
ncbi:protein YgfX [Thalassolituus sp. LLYu03]|uniref:protein YgfX n=1 Tax=Thalassolituus sp. LLYu03 TaxID=3421656 RepID=UPI003D2951C3